MEENSRRGFLKRLGIGSAVVAGSFGFIQMTTPKHERGEHISGNGVIKGSSRKEEILYQKTANWDKFYKNAL